MHNSERPDWPSPSSTDDSRRATRSSPAYAVKSWLVARRAVLVVPNIVVEAGKVTKPPELRGRSLRTPPLARRDRRRRPGRSGSGGHGRTRRDPRGGSGGFVEFQTDRDGRATVLTPAPSSRSSRRARDTRPPARLRSRTTPRSVLERRPPARRHAQARRLDRASCAAVSPSGRISGGSCETGSERPAEARLERSAPLPRRHRHLRL